MKMRSLTALVLVLVLLGTVVACAEYSVTDTYTFDTWYSMSGNTTFAIAERDGYYLYNNRGERISDCYSDMNTLNGDFYTVVNESGLNVHGAIDGTGALIVPMQYGDVDYVSDRWLIGVTLTEGTGEHHDYESWSGDYYLVDSYDVYYCGSLVATIGRAEYDYAYGFGDYLYIEDRDGNSHFYDKNFNPSSCTEGSYYNEYEYDYSSGTITHLGSGQQAFTKGCTLTPEEVAVSIWEDDGIYYDLQGNEIFRANYSYYYDFDGDYAKVESHSLYGLIDKNGNEVAECQYDDISYDLAYLSACGYTSASKDGKFCFIDANNTITYQSPYSYDVVESYGGPIAYIQDLDGTYRILTACAGELEERYTDVRLPYVDGCPFCFVENADGTAGVIDYYGNMVIAPDGTFDDTYDFSAAADGSFIIGDADDVCYVYLIENTNSESVVVATLTRDEGQNAETPASAEATAWMCESCGRQNEGNFCTECGAKKPEAASNVCANCGYTFPEGTSPKFCSECGTPVQ